jgi:ATP-dependent helicase/nuclease subunit A
MRPACRLFTIGLRSESSEVTKSHLDCVEQVRSYARILVELGLARERAVRCGLRFTADGGLRWV